MWFYCIWIYGEVSSRNFVNVVLLYLDLWRGFVKDFVNVVPLYLDQWRGFVKGFRQCGSVVVGSMERFRIVVVINVHVWHKYKIATC